MNPVEVVVLELVGLLSPPFRAQSVFPMVSRLSQLLIERPYITNSVLAGTVLLCGDLCAQTIEHRQAQYQKPLEPASLTTATIDPGHRSTTPSSMPASTAVPATYDVGRTAAMSVWGMGPSAAPMVVWFSFLSRTFPPRPSGSLNPFNLFKLVACNQLIAAPVMNTLFFGYTQWTTSLTAQPGSHEADWVRRWQDKVKAELIPVTLKSTLLFGVVHSVSFGFLPAQYRVLLMNVVLVGWTGYLSYVGHRVEK